MSKRKGNIPNRFKGAVDLANIKTERENQAKKEKLFGHDIVDMLPTERIVIAELTVWANRLFRDVATRDYSSSDEFTKALARYSCEVDDKFLEAGWGIFIDAFNVEEAPDGTPYLAPVLEITGRIEETDFDFDKAKGEVQAGLLDGIRGKITEDGRWHDPDVIV